MDRNYKAEKIYAEAWSSWLMSTSKKEKHELERIMDEQQSFIAAGPNDPRWKSFVNSLPGFNEFWSRFRE